MECRGRPGLIPVRLVREAESSTESLRVLRKPGCFDRGLAGIVFLVGVVHHIAVCLLCLRAYGLCPVWLVEC